MLPLQFDQWADSKAWTANFEAAVCAELLGCSIGTPHYLLGEHALRLGYYSDPLDELSLLKDRPKPEILPVLRRLCRELSFNPTPDEALLILTMPFAERAQNSSSAASLLISWWRLFDWDSDVQNSLFGQDLANAYYDMEEPPGVVVPYDTRNQFAQRQFCLWLLEHAQAIGERPRSQLPPLA